MRKGPVVATDSDSHAAPDEPTKRSDMETLAEAPGPSPSMDDDTLAEGDPSQAEFDHEPTRADQETIIEASRFAAPVSAEDPASTGGVGSAELPATIIEETNLDNTQNSKIATVIEAPKSKKKKSKKNKNLTEEQIFEISKLLPQYQLLNKIAEGGMGVVFKAQQVTLNRYVAVKLLKTGQFANEKLRQRFVFEAKICAALEHPHIVKIHEVGEVGKFPYYVMDYIEGTPLDSYVKDKNTERDEIARILSQVADAVHHFHTRGIIHRDLKPDNVLIDAKDDARIIDFGVAKSMDRTRDSLTLDGTIVGTPHYMSPEQAAGRVLDIDIRTDVYALGAILYTLLAGQVPYERIKYALILAIQSEDPTPITNVVPDLPWELVAIVNKAMERDRDRRYNTALEMKEDIDRYLNHEPIQARRATAMYRVAKYVRRHRGQVALVSMMVLIFLSSVSFIIYSRINTAMELAKGRERELKAERQRADAQRRLAREAKKAQSTAEALLQEEKKTAKLAQEAAEKEKKLQEQKHEAEKERLKLEQQQKEALAKAKAKAKAEAEQRALASLKSEVQSILELPREDLLTAANNLTRALVLIGNRSEDLKQRAELAKMTVVTALAKQELDKGSTRMADFWLAQAQQLPYASTQDPHQQSLKTLTARLEELKRGLELIRESEEQFKAGKVLAARDTLEQAKRGGARPADTEALDTRIRKACGRMAGEALAKARVFMNAGEDSKAYDKVREALACQESLIGAKSLRDEIARTLALKARIEANRLALVPETRGRALKVLEDAMTRLEGSDQHGLLKQEWQHRRRRQSDAKLEHFRYVPAIKELGNRAVYVAMHELTQGQFRKFLDAQAYQSQEYWDKDCPKKHRQEAQSRWKAVTWEPDEDNRPMLGLSWYEARAYARWFASQTGLKARLPTVNEWLAASAWDLAQRRLRSYPWGDEFDQGELKWDLKAPQDVMANSKDCSNFGLFDMAGSVSEWVVYEAKDQSAAPAVKGADYFGDEKHSKKFALVRTTARPKAIPPTAVARRLGLRLVVDVETAG